MWGGNIDWLPCTPPPPRSNPQPRCLSWPGIEPVTFQFMGHCSNQLSHTGQGSCKPLNIQHTHFYPLLSIIFIEGWVEQCNIGKSAKSINNREDSFTNFWEKLHCHHFSQKMENLPSFRINCPVSFPFPAFWRQKVFPLEFYFSCDIRKFMATH